MYSFQDVGLDEFVSSLHHLHLLQWMGAVMKVQTTDKNNNPQVIHTTPGHQLLSCEEKNCMFIRNKSIIEAF